MMVMTIIIITIKLLHGVKIRLCLVLVLPQQVLVAYYLKTRTLVLKKTTVAIRKQQLLQYNEESTPDWLILSTTLMLKIDQVT